MLNALVQALAQYEVILEPDRDEAEWWAGAPSVLRAEEGRFYLAARMRNPLTPKGQRGYETRILASEDGKHFETVHRITREAAGVAGFERPALLQDPGTGRFKLYSCSELEHGWGIIKFDDAEAPDRFDPKTARPVLQEDGPSDPDFIHVSGYKDPVFHHDGTQWHMFTIGLDRIERIHHFVSRDGEAWERGIPAPLIENSGWHNCYTRPACVLPLAVGYLFVYEGSNLNWHDPVYNIATGLAYSPDLKTFHDLTPREALLTSTTPGDYKTWRYSHWLEVGDAVHVYFEAARPNGSNEIRLGILPKPLHLPA